jgi:hypothetical protein
MERTNVFQCKSTGGFYIHSTPGFTTVIIPSFYKSCYLIFSSSVAEMVQQAGSKGDGTSVAVLHLYDSFHQKCSKLGTVTTLGLKNKGRE